MRFRAWLVFCVAAAAAVSAQSPLPSQPADPNAPTAITFGLAFSGGGGPNEVFGATSIATDAAGNAYIAGYTSSPNLPAVTELRKTGRGWDAFVTKFDPAGRPLWSAYLGGNDSRPGTTEFQSGDVALGIAVDAGGQVHVVGRTNSTDFPVANAFQQAAQYRSSIEGMDGFVAKISSDGSRVIYSSYFGGPDGPSTLDSIAVGPSGEAWIAGASAARQISTHHDLSGPIDNRIFLIKLDPAGGVVWSTRLPGTGVGGLAVDQLGQPHIATHCRRSATFACRPLIAKIDTSGSRFLYQSGFEDSLVSFNGLALSGAGDAVLTGRSFASPKPPNSWPESWGHGSGGSFVRVLDTSGRVVSTNFLSTDFGTNLPSDLVHAAVAADGTTTLVRSTSELKLNTVRPIVAVHPGGPLFVSDNGAATWSNLGGPTSALVHRLTVDRVRGDVYAEAGSIGSTRVWRSADLGATWTQESTPAPRMFTLDPRDGLTQWGASHSADQIYRRSANGRWDLVRRWTAAMVRELAVNPHDGSLWAGTNEGVEVTADGGVTWRSLRDGLPSGADGFAFDPVTTGRVYAFTGAGIYVRSSIDQPWSQLLTANVQTVAVDPMNAQIIYAGLLDDGILRTTDGGQSWRRVVSGTNVASIVFDPNRPGVLYAAGEQAYRSLDNGANWELASNGFQSPPGPRRLVVEPRQSRIFASTRSFGAMPFVMQIDGAMQTGTPRLNWATYLTAAGAPSAIATSPLGSTVVLLRRNNEAVVVKFGR